MIKYIVMWRLKKIEGKTKDDIASETQAEVNKLSSVIKEIKAFEVGINVNLSDKRASDVALLSEFESIESLKKYQAHSEHKKLVKHLGHLTAETRVLGYKT